MAERRKRIKFPHAGQHQIYIICKVPPGDLVIQRGRAWRDMVYTGNYFFWPMGKYYIRLSAGDSFFRYIAQLNTPILSATLTFNDLYLWYIKNKFNHLMYMKYILVGK